VATPPTPSAAAPSSGEVIELSPFQVTTDKDVGYLAGNTLAGSRLNTRLKDTPASISVFTTEFLEDLSAFRLEEALQYAVNVEFWDDDDRSAVIGNGVFSSYQDYRVRGLDTSRARNYFPTANIPTESGLIGRIEDSRGPNSVLFGIGSPGGIINVSTKQAEFGRDFQRVSLSAGSFNEYRGALDVNESLLDNKLSARINLIYNDAQSFRHWEFEEHVRAHVALGYRLTERTTLRAEFERGRVNSNRAVSFNLLDEGVVAFVEAGRPTFTSRTAGTAFDFIGANPNRPFLVYYSNNDTVFNEGRNNFSSMQTQGAGNPITDRSMVDFSVNHGGPGQNRESYFSVLSAFPPRCVWPSSPPRRQ
jgi:outer membrane receptor for ferric coprogen and ferric-rhodotorulic acid